MHWCLGTYASGSTWLFNCVMQAATALRVDRPVVGRFVTQQHEVGLPAGNSVLHVIKTHYADETATAILQRQADAIWISVRDPRDSITSLMQYQGFRFASALDLVDRSARFAARFAADPRSRVFRYEGGFIDNISTLDEIAAGFDGQLAAADRERIFAETRRQAIEALVARLEKMPTAIRQPTGDIIDPATQWHLHHAGRTGEVGRWRRLLTASQVSLTEQRLQDWMATFGYHAELAPYHLKIGEFRWHDVTPASQ